MSGFCVLAQMGMAGVLGGNKEPSCVRSVIAEDFEADLTHYAKPVGATNAQKERMCARVRTCSSGAL